MGLKQYESHNPGLTIVLSPELTEKFKNVVPNGLLKFPPKNPVFTTDNAALQKVIENSKQFKTGLIVNVPTAEELKALDIERRKKEFMATAAELGQKVDEKKLDAALEKAQAESE